MNTFSQLYSPPQASSSKELEDLMVLGMRRNSFVVTLCSVLVIMSVSLYGFRWAVVLPMSAIAVISFLVGLRLNAKYIVFSQRLLVVIVLSLLVYISVVSFSVSSLMFFIPLTTFVYFIESNRKFRMVTLAIVVVALCFSFARFWPEVGVADVSHLSLRFQVLSDCILSTVFTGIFIRSHSVFSRLTIEVAKTQALRLQESVTETKCTIAELEVRQANLSDIRHKTSAVLANERLAAGQIRASQEQLEQFTYAASHDLKEPIRTVRSFFQVIRRRASREVLAKAEIADRLEMIEQRSSTMHNMLERLLLFSRLSSKRGTSKVVSLTDIFRAVLDTAEYSPIIDITINQCVNKVPVDPARIKRLFQELVQNAIEFAHPERPLRLRFETQQLKAGFLTCRLQDNGIGISAENLGKVVQLFQRSESSAKSGGTGLGLNIARAIVECEGGNLWLKSDLDSGTTVHFELPIGEC